MTRILMAGGGLCVLLARVAAGMETSTVDLQPVPALQPSSLPSERPQDPFFRRLAVSFVKTSLPLATRPFQDTARRTLILLPSDGHLPGHLQGKGHWDYPSPLLRWVPRGLTTFRWGKPALMVGNQDHALEGSPKPIGERGSFQISRYPGLPFPLSWAPLYFAFTTPKGIHFRLGARWDDVDDYITLPSVAVKRLGKKRVPRPPPAR